MVASLAPASGTSGIALRDPPALHSWSFLQSAALIEIASAAVFFMKLKLKLLKKYLVKRLQLLRITIATDATFFFASVA